MSALPLGIQLAYLAASVLFIVGLKRLSSPASARSGNLVAAAGMVVAVAATLFIPGLRNAGLLVLALGIGVAASIVGARRVPMTDMPQMVAILNGLGGGAAALVAFAEYAHATRGLFARASASPEQLAGAIIGSVAFSGSVVAYAKLQGLVNERAIVSGLLRTLNIALAAGLLVACGVLLAGGSFAWFVVLLVLALAFGTFMVTPIGGADMPVVISLLNSFTGLAVAAAGFVLDNSALIIAGTLVGASGALLTQLMCRAMNRSLANVLFAGVGAGPVAAAAGGVAGDEAKTVREISAEDAALLLGNIRTLIVVPGYGMAVAQAQHAVREMVDVLAKHGVEVSYAIHPVAGRMPGHMNVLLAEANVPYDQLFDLEQINPRFESADVALVIGANDVVNPAARTDRGSPIYGMPILDADRAKHVIIIKRGMSPGFAGVDNPLYYDRRTLMLFGDAKGAVQKLVEALQNGAA